MNIEIKVSPPQPPPPRVSLADLVKPVHHRPQVRAEERQARGARARDAPRVTHAGVPAGGRAVLRFRAGGFGSAGERFSFIQNGNRQRREGHDVRVCFGADALRCARDGGRRDAPRVACRAPADACATERRTCMTGMSMTVFIPLMPRTVVSVMVPGKSTDRSRSRAKRPNAECPGTARGSSGEGATFGRTRRCARGGVARATGSGWSTGKRPDDWRRDASDRASPRVLRGRTLLACCSPANLAV